MKLLKNISTKKNYFLNNNTKLKLYPTILLYIKTY